MKSAQNDMTAGNPMKIICGFTLPIFIGNVFQQFYNMADAVIVGKFVGNKALAAVGSTGTIMFLIYGFVVGMTAGFTVLTAQKFGAGDMKGMRKTVAGAGILSLLVGALLTVLFMAFMKPLLILMNTPEDIFADAYAYIMIVSGGILAQMLYNLLSSILRALGNSKLPLLFLVISALLNIVLDLVFIVGFGMGAKGAAVATVIAQGVSGILCLFYIIAKIPILHLKREDLDVGSTIYQNQLRIGLPMALQYSITAIGTMMVQSALNILGSYAVAAFTAGNKIENIFTQAYVAIGTTMATYNVLLSGNVIGNLTGVYDQKKVGKIEFLDIHHEDYVLWLSILKKGFIAKNTNTTTAAYRLVKGSISANKFQVLPWQWSIYRDIEQLNLLQSSYHFINYAIKAYFKSKI